MDAQVILQIKKGYKIFIFHIIFIWYSALQIFLVTGGISSITTEIKTKGEGEKWTKLPEGKLPLSGSYIYGLQGLRLATLNNEVFSFGKI